MLHDLIKALTNKDFVSAKSVMESMLQDKIAEKIEEKKLEVAGKMFNEDVEQIDELSKATLQSYIGKAVSSTSDIRKQSLDHWGKYMSASNGNVRRTNAHKFEKAQDKAENRAKNIGTAAMKLAKMTEDLEQIDTGLTEAKIDGPTAIKILNQAGGSTSDFHELGSAEVDTLLHHAKIHKYRTSSNAPGSTARMFHQHLTKIARRHADGYDGPSWK